MDSRAIHEKSYQKRAQRGYSGWEPEFDERDCAALLASRFAPRPCEMLDLGCGGGETSVFFARLGFDVTALDFAPTALSLAREAVERADQRARLVLADMRRPLCFASGSFSFALDHRAFHCLTRPADRRSFLGEVRRVLRPGSLFFSSTIAGLPRDPEMLETVDRRTRANRLGTRYFGEREAILAEIAAAGFRIAAHALVSEPFVVDNLIVLARAPRVAVSR